MYNFFVNFTTDCMRDVHSCDRLKDKDPNDNWWHHSPIYGQCSHYIPPKNNRKSLFSLCFQGIWNRNSGQKWDKIFHGDFRHRKSSTLREQDCEHAQDLSSGFVEWSAGVVIITIPWFADKIFSMTVRKTDNFNEAALFCIPQYLVS